MLRMTSGLLICLFSSVISANTAGELVIPGYSPPGSVSDEITPSLEEKPVATDRQEQSRPTESVATVTAGAAVNKPVLSTEEKEAWQAYLTDLRSCTVGTHILRQINPALLTQFGKIETDKITGTESGGCGVTVMYYGENDPRLLAAHGGVNSKDEIVKYPSGLECQLSRANAETMIAMYTDFLAGKPIKPSDTDPFSKAVADQCNAFIMIDGEKTMVNPNL